MQNRGNQTNNRHIVTDEARKKAIHVNTQRRKERQKAFLKAYAESKCNAYEACRVAMVSFACFRRWVDNYPDFKKKVDREKVKKFQDLQTKSFDICDKIDITNPSNAQVKLLLEMMYYCGRLDGFVRRQEITGADGAPLGLIPAISPDMPQDEATRIYMDAVNGE